MSSRGRINKGRFHPSRISNRQKLMRARDYNKLNEKKKKEMKLLDIKKSNWSENES